MLTKNIIFVIFVLFAILLGPESRSRGLENKNVYLRVMSVSVPIRSGPGGSFSEVGRVGFGEVYRAIERSSDGAWYCIQNTRGVLGWVLSELVWPFELMEDVIHDEPSWISKKIIGPAQLADNRFALSVSGGILENSGLLLARIGFQPSRHYLLEINAAQSNGKTANLIICTMELILTLGPWRSLVPFAAVGVGGAMVLPHRQADLFESGTYALATAGVGLMLSLRGDFTIRMDARRVMMFSNDNTWCMLALTIGGMVFF